jgi:hypothetical protein
MAFRSAFRYISYRKLHDRKLPSVLARFTNKDPEYISTSSPRKADHCSKPILETTDSITIPDTKKIFECCRERYSPERCDTCPYDRYD